MNIKSKSLPVKSRCDQGLPPAAAFYVDLGADCYRATAHTAGPWDPDLQHAGPPTALLARALAGRASPDKVLARLTFELLGPVPVGDLALRSGVGRPGRAVELLEATLCANGRDVVRAVAWAVTPSPLSGGDTGFEPPALPARDTAAPSPWNDSGYVRALSWRFTRGDFAVAGPATVWARPRVALVAGERAGPLERLLVLADSASGVSATVDRGKWMFINPEITIHLHRLPAGDWMGVDAETVIAAGGAGLATATLFDERGAVGRSAQSLLVRPR